VVIDTRTRAFLLAQSTTTGDGAYEWLGRERFQCVMAFTDHTYGWFEVYRRTVSGTSSTPREWRCPTD
jgi:hypothetical protein